MLQWYFIFYCSQNKNDCVFLLYYLIVEMLFGSEIHFCLAMSSLKRCVSTIRPNLGPNSLFVIWQKFFCRLYSNSPPKCEYLNYFSSMQPEDFIYNNLYMHFSTYILSFETTLVKGHLGNELFQYMYWMNFICSTHWYHPSFISWCIFTIPKIQLNFNTLY